MARQDANTLEKQQADIDAVRANLAALEAEQAKKLHDDLKAFNAKNDETYADLRSKQEELNQQYAIETQRQTEADAAAWAKYWDDLEKKAIAQQNDVLDIVAKMEQATTFLGHCRDQYEANLSAYRETIRQLAPNGRTIGADWMTSFQRISSRISSLLVKFCKGNSYFGHIVLKGGHLFSDRATGWREQEERLLASVTQDCIDARRRERGA